MWIGYVDLLERPLVKQIKIAIDPGHGGIDPGAVYKDLKESNIVLDIAKHVRDILDTLGYSVYITRPLDEFVSLKDRCAYVNELKADLLVSIHVNSDPDDDTNPALEAKGEEIWVHPNNKEGRKLAECLVPYIDGIFLSEKFRGIKESSGLYILRNVKNIPVVLIEVGFIDKDSSKDIFTKPENIRLIAEKIAGGIHEYITSKT